MKTWLVAIIYMGSGFKKEIGEEDSIKKIEVGGRGQH
jgi:hypothetical protein